MRGMIAALLVLAAACQDSKAKPPPTEATKTADDCKLFLTKARSTLQELGKAAGATWNAAMEETALNDCRADLAAGKRAGLIDCVLGAKDEAAVRGCFPRYEELVDKQPATP